MRIRGARSRRIFGLNVFRAGKPRLSLSLSHNKTCALWRFRGLRRWLEGRGYGLPDPVEGREAGGSAPFWNFT